MNSQYHKTLIIILLAIELFVPVSAWADMLTPLPDEGQGDVKSYDHDCLFVQVLGGYLDLPAKIVLRFNQYDISPHLNQTNLVNNVQYKTTQSDREFSITSDHIGFLNLRFDWRIPAEYNDKSDNIHLDYYAKGTWKGSAFTSISLTDSSKRCLYIQVHLGSNSEQFKLTPTYNMEMQNFSNFGNYEFNSFRLTKNPDICELQPEPNYVNSTKNDLIQETNNAIVDWQEKLGMGYGVHNPWKMVWREIPLSQQNDASNYLNCNIIIYYKQYFSHDNFITNWSAGGITMYDNLRHKALIEVFYNDFTPSTSLGMTITHELGHAFGLGHYIVSTSQFDRVSSGMEDYPSIMFPQYNWNNHYSIQPVDANEIKKIYGTNGFHAVSSILNKPAPIIPAYIRQIGLASSGGDYIDENNMTSTFNSDPNTAKTMIDYLVFDGLIKVPKNYDVNDREYTFPQNLTDSFVYPWVNNEISDNGFLSYLQYLINNNKIGLE